MTSITFSSKGNTIFYEEPQAWDIYRALDKAMEKKNVFVPEGYTVTAETIQDLKRFAEVIELFGYCIKTRKAFANYCKYSSVKLIRDNDTRA